jgi:hypothetical protein
MSTVLGTSSFRRYLWLGAALAACTTEGSLVSGDASWPDDQSLHVDAGEDRSSMVDGTGLVPDGALEGLPYDAAPSDDTPIPDAPTLEVGVDAAPDTAADGSSETGSQLDAGADASDMAGWRRLCVHETWPQPRSSFAFTFDSARNKFFMFGGTLDGTAAVPTPIAETWEWDPTSGDWTNLSGCDAPPSRWPASKMATMTFDQGRGTAFMFDGATDHAWEWHSDVNDWIDRTPTSLPADWPTVSLGGVRTARAIAYDSDRKIMVLTGGDGNNPPFSLPVWEWDNSAARFINRVPNPLPDMWPQQRYSLGMAYDSARKKTLMFGGKAPTPGFLWDVWEWDGTAGTMTDRTIYPMPSGWQPGSAPETMTYDTPNQRAFVYGGGYAPRDDLWEWNGALDSWSNATPSPRPVAWPQPSPLDTGQGVHFLRMTFDSRRGNTVSFDGVQVWELDGGTMTWTNRSHCRRASSPLPASGVSMAFDSRRGQLVLVRPADSGGLSGNGAQKQPEIWQWNTTAGAWKNITPCILPTPWPVNPQQNHSHNEFVYDSGRDRFVLIPDCVGCQYQETWELDPASLSWVDWTPTAPVAPGSWPPGRWDLRATYDSARGVVVLFGGEDQNPPYYARNDIWEWDGTNHSWTNRTPSSSPHERFASTLMFDPTTNLTILFGGTYNTQANGSRVLDDLWEWDGAAGTWTDRTPAVLPPAWPSARFGHAMAFDARRKRGLLFGGTNNGVLTDTWEWDAGQRTWTKGDATSPPNESSFTMAYDAALDRVFLVGTTGASSGATWQWWGGP